MIKASEINTTGVTPEQIGKAHKVLAATGNYYLVENSKGEIDPSTGYIKEYKVSWAGKARGFSCTCEAGKSGFKNGLCWHLKASVACENEVKQAIAELHRLIAEQSAPVEKVVTNVDTATLARIEAANERAATKPVSKAKPYQPKAFSLLK